VTYFPKHENGGWPCRARVQEHRLGDDRRFPSATIDAFAPYTEISGASMTAIDSHLLRKDTILSRCRQYRYVLWREWDPNNPRYALFIGLNPSTADEKVNDQTIRRCMGFARSWGYGSLCMVNLFAIRATRPKDMKACKKPVGKRNDTWLRRLSAGAGVIIAAWEIHGSYQRRDAAVSRLVGKMHCLGRTKKGQPRHPLYVSGSQQPIPLRKRAASG
jgi:hypothetical protein